MPEHISLAAVGDISLGDHPVCVGIGVRSRAVKHRGGDLAYPLERVSDELRSADLVFGNLETVLSRGGLREGVLASVEMRGEPNGAKRLALAGFNVLNVANNHILQHGQEAFAETLQYLEAAHISPVGVGHPPSGACAPILRDVRGLRVAILGYAFEPDAYWKGPALYAFGPSCDIPSEIRAARQRADIVVCSVHWGEEFIRRPSRAMTELGHRIIDAGAHAVVGHHPHVFHGIERYHHGVIAYSLGNFVFDMLWDEHLRCGLVLRLCLTVDGVQDVRTTFVRIDDDYQPSLVSGDAARALNEELERLSAALGSPPDDDDYSRECALLASRNRRRSYQYFLSHSLRYPPRMWRQIVARSLTRKLATVVHRHGVAAAP